MEKKDKSNILIWLMYLAGAILWAEFILKAWKIL